MKAPTVRRTDNSVRRMTTGLLKELISMLRVTGKKVGIAMLAAMLGMTCAAAINARAGQLVLPSSTLSGTGTVAVAYKINEGFTGKGTLHIRWTDSLNRTVEDV